MCLTWHFLYTVSNFVTVFNIYNWWTKHYFVILARQWHVSIMMCLLNKERFCGSTSAFQIVKTQRKRHYFTVTEHLLWWIQAYLMNTDQCPEAINMFPKRDGEPYTGWGNWELIGNCQACRRRQHSPETQHNVLWWKFTVFFTEADREAGTGTKKDETKGGEIVPRWQGIRWDV